MNQRAKEDTLSEWGGEWGVNKCSANSRSRRADTRGQGGCAWDVECQMECMSTAVDKSACVLRVHVDVPVCLSPALYYVRREERREVCDAVGLPLVYGLAALCAMAVG